MKCIINNNKKNTNAYYFFKLNVAANNYSYTIIYTLEE